MKKITPFLWFDGQAEQAAKFYVSIFKSSKVTSISRWGEAGPGKKGAVMSVTFRLENQDFMALNGGPHFQFTPAISFYVDCKTQAEVDRYWKKLSRGGTMQCGWIKDQFGISWQIIPSVLDKYLHDKDPKRAARVMQAMMKMNKLEIAGLKKAYDGD